MWYNLYGVLGVLGFIIVMTIIGLLSYQSIGGQTHIILPIVAAYFLAIVTPVTIIAIRHQVRLSRIKLIDLFSKNFQLGSSGAKNASVAQAGAAPSAPPVAVKIEPDGTVISANASFEFVRGKYFADLDLEEGVDPTLADVPRFPMMLHADWMLLLCALPYMVLCWFGAFLLFTPVIEIVNPGKLSLVGTWLWPSLLAIGGLSSAEIHDPRLAEAWHVNVLTVACIAFAGAYFYTIRLLLRAVSVFDLSPVTFLRAFAHVLLAMLLAVVLYRVVPSGDTVWRGVEHVARGIGIEKSARQTTPAPGEAGAAGARQMGPDPAPTQASGLCSQEGLCPSGNPTTGVSALWLVVAFAFGFIPDAAIQYLLNKSGLAFKARYNELDEHTKQIPLTLLDGVDHFIAFRMEEANIFDVQNLAAANPIMLHIESPYGIYTTIDWVAQAQLCTVVGPDRFLLLKTMNIRTIFDLQRAVHPALSMPSPVPADPANPAAENMHAREFPPQGDSNLVVMIGSILLRDTGRGNRLRASFRLGGHLIDIADIMNDRQAFIGTTKALVLVMLDDLHVHRLRQIWMHIVRQLNPENASLAS